MLVTLGEGGRGRVLNTEPTSLYELGDDIGRGEATGYVATLALAPERLIHPENIAPSMGRIASNAGFDELETYKLLLEGFGDRAIIGKSCDDLPVEGAKKILLNKYVKLGQRGCWPMLDIDSGDRKMRNELDKYQDALDRDDLPDDLRNWLEGWEKRNVIHFGRLTGTIAGRHSLAIESRLLDELDYAQKMSS